jgi:hypothetical protein
VSKPFAEGLGAVDWIHVPDPTCALPRVVPFFTNNGVIRKEPLQSSREKDLASLIGLGHQRAVILELPPAGTHVHGQLATLLEQGAKIPPLSLTVCVHGTAYPARAAA